MYLRDITEIDGFDNLHQPEGILLELQKKAACLYGADESFYLVNGSTCGILSAVSAALPVGGHILMSRNCHKAAYHAAYLRNLKISYLYPETVREYDVLDGITPENVREMLQKEPDTGAVLIVSPTYEGRISDIRGIAEAVHERGIPLIVDEAHGAHLGFALGFAENSCQAGADLVIHSVHKTLPAPTQTALLHVNGKLIDRDMLKRFLHIYQTSSPSYLLMAGIDNALDVTEREGGHLFRDFKERWEDMLEKLSACKKLKFLRGDYRVQDVGKLVIGTGDTSMKGKELYRILLEKYHLQLEMASERYALAMFTVNDTAEGFGRMTKALLEIDRTMDGRNQADGGAGKRLQQEPSGAGWSRVPGGAALSLTEAWNAECDLVELSESIGRAAGEFINLYPPGIPLLVPGEMLTEELCSNIYRWDAQGLCVQGIFKKGEKIFIRAIARTFVE
jgi:arginine/lysine/ornithine decarboxylase